jgi:uncharacterized damage-inducible protein DinB
VSTLHTPLPPHPRPAADERTTLVEFIDYYRIVFARKCEGLTDEEARRATCPPSDLNVLGLARHMAEVERSWFRRGLGEDAPLIFDYSADEDDDFHPGPDASLDAALARWQAEVDAGRANLARFDLDDMLVAGRDPRKSVRWVLVHLVEEYARHCGHLDLIREAIDGETGD